MILKHVTTCLLFCTLIYLPHTDAESIRADKGATVHLPCHSPPDDSVKGSVKWTKNSATSKHICEWIIQTNIGSSSGDCIPRFTFNRTSFTLSIEKVQLSDSGNYSCKTARMIPPPTYNNISNVILHVAGWCCSSPSTALHPGLSLQLLNSSDDTCVHLLCSLESLNPELVNFTWSREGQRSLHPSTSYDMKSELDLCKPDWSDGDMITCHASYSNSQTQTSIQLPASDKESSQRSPVICVVLFSTFIICIIFIWMFFCISKYKSVTCCSGPST
ncbi:uncharacterized protein [Chanodichthys erythropterus]|uniref:uncharacterized protein n=1 Tax=Chanodichthys erythropterus TaxID=933992 RepID=UPI00351DD429